MVVIWDLFVLFVLIIDFLISWVVYLNIGCFWDVGVSNVVVCVCFNLSVEDVFLVIKVFLIEYLEGWQVLMSLSMFLKMKVSWFDKGWFVGGLRVLWVMWDM